MHVDTNSGAWPASALDFQVDWCAPGTPLRHTWEGLANIDQFRWLVRRDAQEHLTLAHDELGVRHVRAVGMYDDEMRVLANDPAGFRDASRQGARCNWQIVDYVIDSLLELGINPMYTTSFMPSELAAGERTVFSTRSRISQPKNWHQWEALVRDGVHHCIERYGLDIVKNWYFEVWNEPNLMNGFFEGTQADFFRLWQVTAGAIKSVDTSLRVGGPSAARAEWIADLVEFGRGHDCEPDYIITHIYNNDSASKPLSPFDGPQSDLVSTSPHFAAGVVRGVRKTLDAMGYHGEVHWNEWGSSWFPCDRNRESANEAAFIVKTMAEVSQLADYFAYWCLSDIYDQVGYGAETFHGNYGLLNLQGLRKPSYHACQLLGRLGTTRLPVTGDGASPMANAIATTAAEGGQLLVFSHNPPGADTRSISRVDVNLPPGATGVTLTRINDNENNILARWRELGSPAYLKRPQLETLRDANHLQAVRPGEVRLHSDDGVTTATFDLPHPGIAMMEFHR